MGCFKSSLLGDGHIIAILKEGNHYYLFDPNSNKEPEPKTLDALPRNLFEDTTFYFSNNYWILDSISYNKSGATLDLIVNRERFKDYLEENIETLYWKKKIPLLVTYYLEGKISRASLIHVFHQLITSEKGENLSPEELIAALVDFMMNSCKFTGEFTYHYGVSSEEIEAAIKSYDFYLFHMLLEQIDFVDSDSLDKIESIFKASIHPNRIFLF